MKRLTGYLRCVVRPMDPDESAMMTQIVMNRRRGEPFGNDVMHEELLKTACYACVFGRLHQAGWHERVDRDCILFVASVPGVLVLWAFTLALIAEVNGRCDFDGFIAAFPMGLPTSEAMREAWDAQKDGNGRNRVDQLDQWPIAGKAVQS